MKLITVYGSLLEGLGNWEWCLNNKESEKLGEHIVEGPFSMVSFGGFPGLVIDKSKNNKIFVETYRVSDRVYNDVEMLEGYPSFYRREAVNTPFGDSEIYVLNRIYTNESTIKNLVPTGEDGVINWRKYKTK